MASSMDQAPYYMYLYFSIIFNLLTLSSLHRIIPMTIVMPLKVVVILIPREQKFSALINE